MLFKCNNTINDLEEGNNSDNFLLNFATFFDNDNIFTNEKTELDLYPSNVNNCINNKSLTFQGEEQNNNNKPLLLLENTSYINFPNTIKKGIKDKQKCGGRKKIVEK